MSDIDRGLLGLYLADHLSGATAGLSRAENMCRQNSDLPIHDDLVRFREELRVERRTLLSIIERLGLHRRPLRQVVAAVGERAGRLKLNRHLLSRSPMTPVLELELLRGAVMGKQGLWQVLADLSGPLGLDRAQLEGLATQADDQRKRLEWMHAQLRAGAFRE